MKPKAIREEVAIEPEQAGPRQAVLGALTEAPKAPAGSAPAESNPPTPLKSTGQIERDVLDDLH